jgi:cell division septum initiation protein DivIVA
MTIAQPGPATTPSVRVPRFPITVWGYERRYVDSFVTGLVEQLERERKRSDQAERALRQLQQDVEHGRTQVPAWFASVGTEIDQVLDNAGRAAAKLLAEAGSRIQAATDAAELQAAEKLREAEEQGRRIEERAHAVLTDAQAERARIEAAASRAIEEQLTRADRDTKALLERAHDEAQRVHEHAVNERQQLEAEREQLATLRQSMVEQLVQVYAPLGLTLVDARGELQAAPQGHQTRPQEPTQPGATPTGPTPTGASPTEATQPGATDRQPPKRFDVGATPPGAPSGDPQTGTPQTGGADGRPSEPLDVWAKHDGEAP